jgi:hypothetical protein
MRFGLPRDPDRKPEGSAGEAHTLAGNVARPSDLPAVVQEAIRSLGQPLDEQTRAFMEGERRESQCNWACI